MSKHFSRCRLYWFLPLYLLAFSCSQNADGCEDVKQPLTIWMRKWDGQRNQTSCSLQDESLDPEARKREQEYLTAVTTFIDNLLVECSDFFMPSIIIATKKGDPIFKIKDQKKEAIHQILETNVDSFSDALNALIQATPPEHYVLTVSQGVGTHSDGKLEGFGKFIRKGFLTFKKQNEVYGYGWKINYGNMQQGQNFKASQQQTDWSYEWKMNSFDNDGSDPGKCWYNTAALFSAPFISLLKSHPIPKWVDSTAEGRLSILDGEGKSSNVPIGGLEEIYMMDVAIKDNPHSIFVLNLKKSLYMSEKTGTGVNFSDKLLRKVPVAHYYLEKKLGYTDPFQFLKHVKCIHPKK